MVEYECHLGQSDFDENNLENGPAKRKNVSHLEGVGFGDAEVVAAKLCS